MSLHPSYYYYLIRVFCFFALPLRSAKFFVIVLPRVVVVLLLFLVLTFVVPPKAKTTSSFSSSFRLTFYFFSSFLFLLLCLFGCCCCCCCCFSVVVKVQSYEGERGRSPCEIGKKTEERPCYEYTVTSQKHHAPGNLRKKTRLRSVTRSVFILEIETRDGVGEKT